MLSWADHLLSQYGAIAIALGAGLEGEAAVTAGGFLAHRGVIDLRMVVFCAFLGSFVVDQGLFLSARFQRERAYIQRARKRPAFGRALNMIERHPTLFCFVFRFLYGLRIAGPLAIGVSAVPIRRFALLNAMSAAIWAATFSYLGFRFGATITNKAITFALNHTLILVAALSILIVGVLWIFWRTKAAEASAASDTSLNS